MQDFRGERLSSRGDVEADDRRLDAYTSPETKAAMRLRTKILEKFRPEKMEGGLAQVVAEKERVNYPERALWEAIETMMMDEVLRDRLLAKQVKGIEPSPQDRQDYTRVVSKYRILVQFVDDEFHEAYKTQEIIPHVKMGDLRVRLADLLANQHVYFPQEPSRHEDRKEAFQHLKKQFTRERQDGKRAELAVIGLLRHGAQWAWGGVLKKEQFLRPAIHVERTMFREDVLTSGGASSRVGRYSGCDIIFKLKNEQIPLARQLKTGGVIDRPGFVNLAAPHLIEVFNNLINADFMTDERLHEYALVEQRRNYRAALVDIIANLGLDEADQQEMRTILIPPTERLEKKIVRKDAPVSSWSVTFKDLQTMLRGNKLFRDFATLHGVPSSVDASTFTYVGDLIRRLRSEYPTEPFWAQWPKPPKGKKPNKELYGEYVPKYARI